MSIEARTFLYMVSIAKKNNSICFAHAHTYSKRFSGPCRKCHKKGFEAKVQEAWIRSCYYGHSTACSSCRLVIPCHNRSTRKGYFVICEITCEECRQKFYETSR